MIHAVLSMAAKELGSESICSMLHDFGMTLLIALTGFVIVATPLAYVFIAAGEVSGGGGYYYHWLSLIPLGVLIPIWALVIAGWRRPKNKGSSIRADEADL
jgi:hypothetical protein